jgi:hypothetical protein
VAPQRRRGVPEHDQAAGISGGRVQARPAEAGQSGDESEGEQRERQYPGRGDQLFYVRYLRPATKALSFSS